ncbi:MAG: hypothetical protein NE328_11145 [Lentisphaeraceae bacterium]|nr:hypothetical protein [Lentisphaeraceae bacterium]
MSYEEEVEYLYGKIAKLEFRIIILNIILVILLFSCFILGLKAFRNQPVPNPVNVNSRIRTSVTNVKPKSAKQSINDAKIILHGKTTISNGRKIVRLEKVLWLESDIELKLNKGDILQDDKAERGINYGEGEILFYQKSLSSRAEQRWSVHSGLIPTFDDKSVADLLSFVKEIKSEKAEDNE